MAVVGKALKQGARVTMTTETVAADPPRIRAASRPVESFMTVWITWPDKAAA